MRIVSRLSLALSMLSVGSLGCSSGPSAPLPSGPAESPTPATSPAPSPSPAANQAPALDLRVTPTPIAGQAPLSVSVNMCRSFDPDGDPLSYVYEYQGEGKRFSSGCQELHVYTQAVQALAVFCISDGQPRHLICQPYNVAVK